MYCDKSLGNQIVFCKQSCVQYAVKFVNAVLITCNHPKIGIINPRFFLAAPLPCPNCPSSNCCASYMFDDLFVWMGKISGTGGDKNKLLIYSCHALIISVAKPGQLPGHHPSLPQYQQATWIFKNY